MSSYFFLIRSWILFVDELQGGSSQKIQLNKYVQKGHDVFLNTETWKQVDREMKAIMVSREDPSNASRMSCSSPSAKWLQEQTINVPNEDLSNFFDWHLYVIPFAYKLYVKQNDDYTEEYFGLNGEYTEEIKSIHGKAEEFWSNTDASDIGDIFLLCAHGSDLADRDKLISTLKFLFDGSYDTHYTVQDHANDIQDLITRLPGGYNYPLLTFNAFATDEMNDNDPSIIICDGYFQFQKFVGMESEGPEYAHTHEFAHHLQFLLGVTDTESGLSQFSRKQELMADAFSAYFLAHDSGGDMTSDEISNIHTVAYSVGDCETSNHAHHGTPNERRCATVWGARMADSEEGSVLHLIELANRFDTWFERIDDLDELCEFTKSAASFNINPFTILQALPTLLGVMHIFLN